MIFKEINLEDIASKIVHNKPTLGLKSFLKNPNLKLVCVTPSYHKQLLKRINEEEISKLLAHPGYRLINASRDLMNTSLKLNHMVNVISF